MNALVCPSCGLLETKGKQNEKCKRALQSPHKWSHCRRRIQELFQSGRLRVGEPIARDLVSCTVSSSWRTGLAIDREIPWRVRSGVRLSRAWSQCEQRVHTLNLKTSHLNCDRASKRLVTALTANFLQRLVSDI